MLDRLTFYVLVKTELDIDHRLKEIKVEFVLVTDMHGIFMKCWALENVEYVLK